MAFAGQHFGGEFAHGGNTLQVRIPRHNPAIVLDENLVGRCFPNLLEPRLFGGGVAAVGRRGGRILDLGHFMGVVQSSLLQGCFVNIGANIPPRAMFELVTALAAGPMAGLGARGAGGMGMFGMDHGLAIFLRQMLEVREYHRGRVVFPLLLAHYASLMAIASVSESAMLMTFLEEFFMSSGHIIALEESVEGLVEWSRYLMHSPFPQVAITSCLRQILHARRTTCTEVRNMFGARRDCQTEEVLMQLEECQEHAGLMSGIPRMPMPVFEAAGRRLAHRVHFEELEGRAQFGNGGCALRRGCSRLFGQCCSSRQCRQHSTMQSTLTDTSSASALMTPLLPANGLSTPLMLRNNFGGFGSTSMFDSGYASYGSAFGGFGAGSWM
jgi:hypothetical protein